MNYSKETYIGEFGPFDYLIIPKNEYSYELVAKVHDMPFLLSEWHEFYRARFEMVNGVEQPDKVIGDIIKLPIITEAECWRLGL